MRDRITIASRRSELARVQAEGVAEALRRAHAGLRVEMLWVESEGDRRSEASLAEVGGKGLFTRGIDGRVLTGEADLAVHSLKDVPVRENGRPDGLEPGLRLAAVPLRANPGDCLIARGGAANLAHLPSGCTLATSSPRRAAQAKRLRPDLRIVPIRGNVPTRIARVLSSGDGEASLPHATLLAAAGLHRLGLSEHARARLAIDDMLPAACQGSLGLVCREEDAEVAAWCGLLNDHDSKLAAEAERAVVRSLGADCHSPVAVLAAERPVAEGGGWSLHARVLEPDGSELVEARYIEATLAKAVEAVCDALARGGAVELLAAITSRKT